MAAQNRGPVIFLILIMIAALITTGLGYLALQREKQNSETLSKKLSALEEDKRIVDSRIIELQQQLDETQKSLKDTNARIAVISEDLENEKKAKEEALGETAKMKNELALALKTKTELEARLRAGEEKLGNVQEELSSIKTSKESLEQKLKDLEAKNKSVQLDKIVVSSPPEDTQAQGRQPPAPSPAPISTAKIDAAASTGDKLEGKVLVVNEEYDFIVINLGRKDNLNVGDTLTISRKNKKVGQVKIEEVRDTMSVATPLSKGLIKQIREEDTATLK